jgi:hypothetical protein
MDESDVDEVWYSHSAECGEIPTDSLVSAAAHELVVGDSLGAGSNASKIQGAREHPAVKIR